MKKLVYCLFLVLGAVSIKAQDIVKPNVIIFYTDDLGWQDSQLNDDYGTDILAETPNMLRLAQAGAKFSNAYSPAPTCAPSRGGLLSGRHPAKNKLIQVSGGGLPSLTKAKSANRLMAPFFPKRMALEEYTIAEAMKAAGYTTGHIGKWHVEGENNSALSTDQGFDSKFTGRGMHQNMGDRFTGYATDDANDKYKIDEDGRPFDEVTEEALIFMDENKDEPFFMYMATWLVHTPIQTRDIALLTYYCNKLGIPVPTSDVDIATEEGQANPYYAAMIATVDWSLGKVIDYLEATDDPRNPGKKLFETTYIIFSSDNGASEQDGSEIVTDNFPLDQGKTKAKEGGVRVPLVITGPDIISNVEYDNLANGLDFYPTVLSMAGATIGSGNGDAISTTLYEDLDGANLLPLLKGESTIVEDMDGNERTDLYWHYPSGDNGVMRSSIRSGEYKLYRVYAEEGTYHEAFQLYDSNGNNVDHEEMIDVINFMPEALKTEMISKLDNFLIETDARLPQWNPDYDEADAASFTNLDAVPSIATIAYNQTSKLVTATRLSDATKASIASGYLLYQEANNEDEWFESGIATVNGDVITAVVPDNAVNVAFTLRDENNFLVLSDELEIENIPQITLNVTDVEQIFQPESDQVYAELVGSTTANSAFVQMRTAGGGDGVNINVAASQSVVCEKITFRVRSQDEDTANFKVTIGDAVQAYEYTSTRSADDVYFEFTTPITFTNTAQSMEVLLTGLSNSDNSVVPRFRIYDITFHLDLTTLGIEDVIETSNGVTLNIVPNPVKNSFSLSDQVISGRLYNMNGQEVLKFNNRYTNIDVSGIRSGLYILKVLNANNTESYLKFIKE